MSFAKGHPASPNQVTQEKKKHPPVSISKLLFPSNSLGGIMRKTAQLNSGDISDHFGHIRGARLDFITAIDLLTSWLLPVPQKSEPTTGKT